RRRARGHAPRSYRGEFWILLYLQAPGLVIGEVPVQDIELVQGHPVDELLDELRRLVVTAGIEHQPSPRKARRVADFDGAYRADAALRRKDREFLPKGHRAIEESRRVVRTHHDALRLDAERVFLWPESLRTRIEHERHALGAGTT